MYFKRFCLKDITGMRSGIVSTDSTKILQVFLDFGVSESEENSHAFFFFSFAPPHFKYGFFFVRQLQEYLSHRK